MEEQAAEAVERKINDLDKPKKCSGPFTKSEQVNKYAARLDISEKDKQTGQGRHTAPTQEK